MKAFVAVLAVLGLASLAEAIFLPQIVGTSVVLGSVAAGSTGSALVSTATALVGGALVLKAVGLLAASGVIGRTKRSEPVEGITQEELTFGFIAQSEPQACYRRLICDLATGTLPKSENDVILASFDGEVPVTSSKFEYNIAAQVGKALKNVQACELRYSCPLTGQQITKLFN